MFVPDDTIAAIATPPGRGGIGVVRLSGPRAQDIARTLLTHSGALQPRYATFSKLVPRPVHPSPRPSAGRVQPEVHPPVGDEVVATFFPAPHSYTGQDVVEISAHGSPVVLQAIVASAIAAGARLAEPGEFTLRAFLNGKRDLMQSEAVADLIDAVTPLQARVAFDQLDGTLTTRIAAIDAGLFDLIARLEASLDFPDEGYHFIAPEEIADRVGAVVEQIDDLLRDATRGRMIREGAQVVIAGRPNVGKSSIFNRLSGSERAIVTAVPGTTRDLVTERVDIGGLAVTLVDTAGARDTLDVVEREGVARGDRARAVADLVIVVLDASEESTDDDRKLLERTASRRRLIVVNKIDLATETRSAGLSWSDARSDGANLVETAASLSATTGEGLDELRTAIAHTLTGSESLRDSAAISNVRHIALLQDARAQLDSARSAARGGAPEEFVLADMQAARHCFDEIVGRRTSDDLLAHIFAKFCIGK